jgi:macrodomain Ter protein organizer (MatP/YcbG family)|tara:strand:+ start:746 stop:922 length:177 start_codon:yes stop_codon:yes gene_type:complete
MTDITKYKSVAVKLPVWNKLQSFAQQDLRSVGKVIEWLTDKEDKTRKKRKVKNGGAHA